MHISCIILIFWFHLTKIYKYVVCLKSAIKCLPPAAFLSPFQSKDQTLGSEAPLSTGQWSALLHWAVKSSSPLGSEALPLYLVIKSPLSTEQWSPFLYWAEKPPPSTGQRSHLPPLGSEATSLHWTVKIRPFTGHWSAPPSTDQWTPPPPSKPLPLQDPYLHSEPVLTVEFIALRDRLTPSIL